MSDLARLLPIGFCLAFTGSAASAQFGTIAEVKKPDQAIQHNVDLTPNPEYKGLTGVLTHGVVTRRVDDKTIELGVGTRLQIAFVGPGKATSTLGYPGSRVTLQPGTSIIWQGMEVSPEGKGPVIFTVVDDKGKLTLSVEAPGKLKYSPPKVVKPK